MLEMAFSSTQTAHIFALAWFLTVMELVSKKHCRAATIINGTSAVLGKNKVPLSPLRKHNNEADHNKTCILAVWIAIVNRKSSKAIVSVPTIVYRSIYYHAIYQYHSIYHAFSIVPLHLPSGFHLNIAWFL